MLRHIHYFVFLTLIITFSAQASPFQEERRIEEENRSKLLPTEVAPHFSTKSTSPLEGSSEAILLTRLLSEKQTTLKDAVQVLCILLGSSAPLDDFDAQALFLKDREIFPSRSSALSDPGLKLRKGLAAYMFCRALSLKGGVTMRIFGISERYALRELAYEGIMVWGSTQEYVSGDELVETFANAAQMLIDRSQNR